MQLELLRVAGEWQAVLSSLALELLQVPRDQWHTCKGVPAMVRNLVQEREAVLAFVHTVCDEVSCDAVILQQMKLFRYVCSNYSTYDSANCLKGVLRSYLRQAVRAGNWITLPEKRQGEGVLIGRMVCEGENDESRILVAVLPHNGWALYNKKPLGWPSVRRRSITVKYRYLVYTKSKDMRPYIACLKPYAPAMGPFS
jgi:hypothetical protein